MYPILKLARVLIGAKFRRQIGIRDKGVVQFGVGLTDADLFGELNNARYLTFMELGRWDYSSRIGFVTLMKSKKWGLAVGGASIRYRRRIPLFSKFTLTTQLLGHDGRWFYFLQEFHARGKICASALMKVGATSKQGLVPANEVMHAMGEELDAGIPDWVDAWIEAESLRPWPETSAQAD
jgi:acyl-CoA thioesterase FadM